MIEIDLETWTRRAPYELFRTAQNPHFSVTADIDISRFVEEIKPSGLSVFNAVLFAIMKAVNSIPEFRNRFQGERIYQHAVSHPSFTIPIGDKGFAFCETNYSDNWREFDTQCSLAKQKAKNQTQLIENVESDHWTYLTCTPWLHFTALSHAYQGPEDCIPRIAWGKFSKREGHWWMPLNIQAHHALMDGYHMAKLFELTEKALREEPFSQA